MAAAALTSEEAAKAAWLVKQDTPAVGAPGQAPVWGGAPAPAWGGAPAPAPAAAATRDSSSADWGEGEGEGFDGEATRDPEPAHIDPSDPKAKQQAIHKAESFAEYLARRQA